MISDFSSEQVARLRCDAVRRVPRGRGTSGAGEHLNWAQSHHRCAADVGFASSFLNYCRWTNATPSIASPDRSLRAAIR